MALKIGRQKKIQIIDGQQVNFLVFKQTLSLPMAYLMCDFAKIKCLTFM